MKTTLRSALVMFSVLALSAYFLSTFRSANRQPAEARAAASSFKKSDPVRPPAPQSPALDAFIEQLSSAGCSPSNQAVLIQTLDGKILAEHNADTPLNPASVMKLSVSFLALKNFGPDYRFKTAAYTTGHIDESNSTLYGDIVIEAEGDPNFTYADAAELAASVRSQGIKRVEGDLLVTGPFRFRHRSSPDFAYAKMRSALGIAFPKKIDRQSRPLQDEETASAAPSEPAQIERSELGVHYSQPLKELIYYMNAHSDNHYGDQIGEALGGPEKIREGLINEFHIKPELIYIESACGLHFNRITARDSLLVLQGIIHMIDGWNMRIEDVMPVAGVDSGTLIQRLRKPEVLGSIIAKTGTLNATDDGVAVLEGAIYTERYGVVLFAIFNTRGGVNYYRRRQDRYLLEAIAELDTPLKPVRTENILALNESPQPLQPKRQTSRRLKRVKNASARASRRS